MVQKDIGFPNGDMRNAAGTANIGGKGWRLRPEAARALEALASAFRSRFAYTLPILETHRSLAEQQRLWDLYQSGQGNLAARPGTSVHGWGLAIDLGSPLNLHGSTESGWMRSNMGDYGFWDGGQASWPQKEPWHIEYRGGGSKEPGGVSSTMRQHTVKEGQTLVSIGTKYRVSTAWLRSQNGLTSDVIKVGQKLWVTVKYVEPYGKGTAGTYTVKTWPGDVIYFLKGGDTVNGVARAHGISEALLIRMNNAPEKGFTHWPVGLGVRLTVKHAPLTWEYLDLGSKGLAVLQVQNRLNVRGARLVVDGDYGSASRSAVADFQERQGMSRSGRVDRGTWDALFKEI